MNPAEAFLNIASSVTLGGLVVYALLWGLAEVAKRAANRWWGRRGR